MDIPWNKVDKTETCWNWLGELNEKGYGRHSFKGRKVAVHRYFYSKLVGPILKGLQIDHLCFNRKCVNPSHLEAVTPRENIQRAWNRKGKMVTCPKGHPYSGDNLYTHFNKKKGLVDRFCKECRRNNLRQFRKK